MRRVASAVLSPRDELRVKLDGLSAEEVRELMIAVRSHRSTP